MNMHMWLIEQDMKLGQNPTLDCSVSQLVVRPIKSSSQYLGLKMMCLFCLTTVPLQHKNKSNKHCYRSRNKKMFVWRMTRKISRL